MRRCIQAYNVYGTCACVDVVILQHAWHMCMHSIDVVILQHAWHMCMCMRRCGHPATCMAQSVCVDAITWMICVCVDIFRLATCMAHVYWYCKLGGVITVCKRDNS